MQSNLIIADIHIPTTWMGAPVSHVSRWFFMQPQIGENIRGVLPSVIEGASFDAPDIAATYFGYIAIFSSWHILDNDNDSKYAYMKIFGQTLPKQPNPLRRDKNGVLKPTKQ